MTEDEADAIGEALAEVTRPLLDRIEALEKRVAEVERHGIKYCGVYQRALTYPRGSVVTVNDGAWVALRQIEPATEAPGAGAGWQLLVKARDGRKPDAPRLA